MMKIHEEASRCLLCVDGACSKACPKSFDPSRLIRAVRFKNDKCAGLYADKEACAKCTGECEKACIHYDRPIRIKEIIERTEKAVKHDKKDLSIEFLGVKCENPLAIRN